MTSLRRTFLCLLVAVASPALHASDLLPGFTLNLPFAANAATPAWLAQPIVGSAPFATLDLPVTPPDATASLLITVFFQEQNGGFLRISWQADGANTPVEGDTALPGPGESALSSVLSDNFYEGIGMSNQRRLLVPADVLKQPGALHFQTGSTTLGITRIHLEWLENTVGLTSPALNDVVVTPADGHAVPASEVAGLPPLAQDPAWQGHVVNVPVTDVPLRIEEGLDFTVQIDSPPTLARVELKEAGLPWGQHLVVWVNSHRTGLLIPATPQLDNGGYSAGASGTYVGWREGSFFLPAAALAAGPNTLQFSAEPDVPPATAANAPASPAAAPLAVKDVVLQLAYPAVAASAPTAAAPTPSTATSLPATAAADPNSLAPAAANVTSSTTADAASTSTITP
jgi:hypothetical protein